MARLLRYRRSVPCDHNLRRPLQHCPQPLHLRRDVIGTSGREYSTTLFMCHSSGRTPSLPQPSPRRTQQLWRPLRHRAQRLHLRRIAGWVLLINLIDPILMWSRLPGACATSGAALTKGPNWLHRPLTWRQSSSLCRRHQRCCSQQHTCRLSCACALRLAAANGPCMTAACPPVLATAAAPAALTEPAPAFVLSVVLGRSGVSCARPAANHTSGSCDKQSAQSESLHTWQCSLLQACLNRLTLSQSVPYNHCRLLGLFIRQSSFDRAWHKSAHPASQDLKCK